MYKSITIDTGENIITCNAETVCRKTGGYKDYFRCGQCANQSVGDDDPIFYNCADVITDKSDIKRYCLNYRKDKSE
jgi:hypothetical protein